MKRVTRRRATGGAITLLIVLVVSALIGISVFGLMNTHNAKKALVYSRLNGLEGFYTNEFAQWSGFERFIYNLDAGLTPDEEGRFQANLELSYERLRSNFAGRSYSTGGNERTPYGLTVTRQFDGSGGDAGNASTVVHQRVQPGRLFYRVSP
jgi:hypothetical protein